MCGIVGYIGNKQVATIVRMCIVWLLALILLSTVPSLSAQDSEHSAYAILIDNTGSMRLQLQREIEIAKEVVKQAKKESSFSLFGFTSSQTPKTRGALVAAGIECTTDREEVVKQLDGIATAIGQTTLLDAMKIAAERLDSENPSKCGEFSERNLIVISDGEDRSSITKLSELITSLKQSRTSLFVIALTDDLSSDRGFMDKSPRDKVKEFLQKLVKETGGKVLFPKKKQTPEEIVRELFATSAKPKK